MIAWHDASSLPDFFRIFLSVHGKRSPSCPRKGDSNFAPPKLRNGKRWEKQLLPTERKLEEEKPADVWNAKKRKWTKPSSQIRYKAMTAREMFSDMKEDKSCVKFVGRCEELLVTGKFEIEGNDVGNKFRVAGAGAPKKCPSVRKELFDFFIDIRSSLTIVTKAESLHRDYCEWKREEGVEPEKLTFSNRWLKDWCKEYQISIKKPNKRFSISASARKKRIADFLKNIWTVRHTFTKLYGVDPEIVISDQMPLHRNESSNEKTLNFKDHAVKKSLTKRGYFLVILPGVVDNVPPDEGCEVLDGELTDKEWDENDNENVADSDDEEDNVLPKNDVPQPEDEPTPGYISDPVDPELNADLECLSRIESAISSGKKSSTANLLSFLIRVENMLAGERQRRKGQERKTRKTNRAEKQCQNR
eukprot:gene15578-17152_t